MHFINLSSIILLWSLWPEVTLTDELPTCRAVRLFSQLNHKSFVLNYRKTLSTHSLNVMRLEVVGGYLCRRVQTSAQEVLPMRPFVSSNAVSIPAFSGCPLRCVFSMTDRHFMRFGPLLQQHIP